jgi:DNA-binding Xre family transcriptional regulator
MSLTTNLPTVETKLINLALSALILRIKAMPKADQCDLLDLFQALRETDDDEEVASIHRAMEEILAQRPLTVVPLSETLEESPSKKAKEWAGQIGKNIRWLREAAKLNQTELAEKAGLTQSHISRLENGEHHAAHFTIEKIAGALGVPVGAIAPRVDV